MTSELAAFPPGEATLSQVQEKLSPLQRVLADEYCLRRSTNYQETRLGEFLADLRERTAVEWEDEGPREAG